MNCPRCQNEMSVQEVTVIYGIKGNMVEELAQGDLRITSCAPCGVAFLSDKPAVIEVPEQTIITEV